MGQLYGLLGLQTGIIQHDQDPTVRRAQYYCGHHIQAHVKEHLLFAVAGGEVGALRDWASCGCRGLDFAGQQRQHILDKLSRSLEGLIEFRPVWLERSHVAGITVGDGVRCEDDGGIHPRGESGLKIGGECDQPLQVVGAFQGMVVKGQKPFTTFSAACWQ